MDLPIDPNLLPSDVLVLNNLLGDINRAQASKNRQDGNLLSDANRPVQCIEQNQHSNTCTLHEDKSALSKNETKRHDVDDEDVATIDKLLAMNSPDSQEFEPTVFMAWDYKDIKLPPLLDRWLLQPYIQWARTVVRTQTDVVMLTHIILYLTTSIPSAIFLFYRFSWTHGILHWLMQSWYAGSFTLMMHQHIHNNGVLAKRYAWFDRAFPYFLEPLMGHTWDSYYYHHVKHHHVEGNGPDDLSTTIRYQRDDVFDFLKYVGRFFFLVWIDLPMYFIRKRKPGLAIKAAVSEFTSYLAIYLMYRANSRATICVFLLPLLLLRAGLMIGNWGQHAFVDEVAPDSDFRSSITLLDVPSNRFCFNDGYHTSHHLNPRRHWRDHPVAFLKAKETYAQEQALVFRNIDYLMITFRLLRKDYAHLARCLVPMGEQIGMSLEERASMLRSKTARFSEEEIRRKFK